jgi:hypothetical protein
MDMRGVAFLGHADSEDVFLDIAWWRMIHIKGTLVDHHDATWLHSEDPSNLYAYHQMSLFTFVQFSDMTHATTHRYGRGEGYRKTK